MLRSNLQTQGARSFAKQSIYQSAILGQVRTLRPRKTLPPFSDLTRPAFGKGTLNPLGLDSTLTVRVYQEARSPMASDYSTRLEAVHQYRPHSPSPATGTARSNLAKVQLRNFSVKMVTHSVNKTALHPGGVEYVVAASFGPSTPLTRYYRPSREHTELEEELHTTAHIDYDRVAIVANPSVSALYEDALVYETGSAITSSGALTAYSGSKTGRSPLDKRVVKEESSEKDVWWGPVNKPMSPEVSNSPFHNVLPYHPF